MKKLQTFLNETSISITDNNITEKEAISLLVDLPNDNMYHVYKSKNEFSNVYTGEWFKFKLKPFTKNKYECTFISNKYNNIMFDSIDELIKYTGWIKDKLWWVYVDQQQLK